MNYVIIGIFSLNQQAIEGAILLMFGHGLVSSCFFLLVGILYERYHTRYYKYFSGLAQIMPKFALFFFIFSFSNISFPCTCNFIGEFLILLGVLKINLFITILIASSIILSSIYSILLFNRICFGNLKINYIKTFLDLQTKEIFYFLPFIFLILFLGIYPQIFLDYIQLSIKTIL
jgi:NADH-quinone oxidoreductase subunit M